MKVEASAQRAASGPARVVFASSPFGLRHGVTLMAVGLVACVTASTDRPSGLDDALDTRVRAASLSIGAPAPVYVDATVDDATLDGASPTDAGDEASDAGSPAVCQGTLTGEQLLDERVFALLTNEADAGTPIPLNATLPGDTAAPPDGGASDGSGGIPEAGFPNDAPYGEGGACACPTVTVHCHAPADGGFEATCTADCVVVLPPNVCAMHNLHDGSVVDPISLIGSETWPNPPTAQSIFDYCIADHEARHACDHFVHKRMCLTEINAYAVTAKCLDDAYKQLCAGDVKPNFCFDLRMDTLFAAGEANMNQCLCGDPMETCADCIFDCKLAAPNSNPFWNMGCDASKLYCLANGR